jgi:hypothetical protein
MTLTASPFEGYGNAYFALGSGLDVPCRAVLREKTPSSRSIRLQLEQLGLQESETYLEGYLIEPYGDILPSGTVFPLNVPASVASASGLLRFLPIVISPFGVAPVTGYPLRAIFRVAGQ